MVSSELRNLVGVGYFSTVLFYGICLIHLRRPHPLIILLRALLILSVFR